MEFRGSALGANDSYELVEDKVFGVDEDKNLVLYTVILSIRKSDKRKRRLQYILALHHYV